MLAGMASKWRWRDRMRAAGKPTDRPNLVTGANVQVCWEKFGALLGRRGPKLVPMEGSRYHLTGDEVATYCDENTIGVVSVLGSTFDGSYEPVAEICRRARSAAADSGGLDVPVHVDGASGGFIAPFVEPELEWDFRLPRVQSINASGHKYGLVYPGVGWAIWRDKEALPAGPRLRRQLPRRRHADVRAQLLASGERRRRAVLQVRPPRLRGLSGSPAAPRATWPCTSRTRSRRWTPSELLTDGSRAPGVRLHPQAGRHRDVHRVRRLGQLREAGWLVPAYTFPENRQDLAALRVVVRAGMTHDMADLFLDDVRKQTAALEKLKSPLPDRDPEAASGFRH